MPPLLAGCLQAAPEKEGHSCHVVHADGILLHGLDLDLLMESSAKGSKLWNLPSLPPREDESWLYSQGITSSSVSEFIKGT